MFSSLLSLGLLALTTVDTASINRHSGKTALRFATKINGLGTINIAERDRARVQAMKQASLVGEGSSIVDMNTGVSYVVQVGIGSPPTNYTLILDTGSSNTWVGAGKHYVPTRTSRNTMKAISLNYVGGNFSGIEWIDTVTLSPDLVIDEQLIGVASQSESFHGVDGVLGVGPVDLTEGTVNGMKTVTTVLDNLLSQGTISREVLGIYFIPETNSATKGGELTFGGYDQSATVGPVFYFPSAETRPAANYWGINQSIMYGDDEILSSTSGIVDTGTTLTLIATDAFEKYKSMTGGVSDSATGLLKITPEQYANLKPLVFTADYVPLVLTPNAQTWPRSLNSAIGGSACSIYLVVADIGPSLGSAFGFINGYTFLERFYSVYDTTEQRVGFAYTEHTFSDCN